MDNGSSDAMGIMRCGCGTTQHTNVAGAIPMQLPNGLLPLAIEIPPGWTVEEPKLVTAPGQQAAKIVRCPRCSARAARAANTDASQPPAKVLSMDAGKERGQ